MSNLRIVSTNLADTGTTTASNAVGTLVAANLRSDIKALVLRSSTIAARISQAFSTPQTVGFAGFAYTNFSPTATMRVRATAEAAATNLLTVRSSQCEAWGSAPLSVRYVQAPDGTYTGVVPLPDAAVDRWEFSIPANTYPNGTVLVISWHQKTVTPTGSSGQQLNANTWVGATPGSITTLASANGWSRKWCTVTITATASIQSLRFYTPTIGADDIAAWGWMLELGTTPTSYYPTLNTFTARASVGTYIDINGKVATAASGVARMQYHYPDLAAVAPILLVEAAATNYATQSQDFTQAVWVKSSAGAASVPVVTANYSTAPDGALTADRLVCVRTGNTTADYSLISRTVTGPASGAYANSIWMRSNTGANQYVVLSGTTRGQVMLVTPVWQRFSVPDTSGTTSWTMLFGTRGGTGFPYTGGDASLDISIWQGQMESGSVPTSDIVTTASTAARVADTFTVSAATRPVGYMDWWQSYTYDSGDVLCCPWEASGVEGYTAAQSASLYQYGGGTHARVWFPAIAAYNFSVDVTDTANLQGYVEMSRFILGNYWEPLKNADYGASAQPADLTKNSRSDAGDLISDIAPRYDKLSMSLSKLDPADRAKAWNIIRRSGVSRPMFVSLFPNDADPSLEDMHQVFGKLVTVPSMSTPFFNLASASFEIEGV